MKNNKITFIIIIFFSVFLLSSCNNIINKSEKTQSSLTFYVMDKDMGLCLFEKKPDNSPELIKKFNFNGIQSFISDNQFLYLVYDKKLEIYNVSDKMSPSKISDITLDSTGCSDIYISGNKAVLMTSNSKTFLIDISDKMSPVVKCTLDLSGKGVMNDEYLYLYTAEGIKIYEIKNLNNTFLSGTVKITYNQEAKLFLKDNYLYIADGESLRIADISVSSKPLNLNVYNYRCADVFVDSKYIYLYEKFSDYSTGFYQEIYNLRLIKKDEKNFEQVGMIKCDSFISSIKVIDNQILLAKGNYGLEFYEMDSKGYIKPNGKYSELISLNHITTDKDNVFITDNNVLRYAKSNNMQDLKVVYTFDNIIQKVIIKDNKAYLSVKKYGVVILDITNPDKAVKTGEFKLSNVEDNMVVKDNTLIVSDFYNGVYIFDISAPDKLVQINYLKYTAYCITYFTRYAYYRHTILYENNRLYIGHGEAIYIYDASDLKNLKQITFIYDYSDPALHVSHDSVNIAIKDNYLYGVGGKMQIIIFDISNPAVPMIQYGSLYGYYYLNFYHLSIREDIMYAVHKNDADKNILELHSIENRTQPQLIFEIKDVSDYYFNGNTLYTAKDKKGIEIYDATDNRQPVLKDKIRVPHFDIK